MIIHNVKKGEYLGLIAKMYETTISQIVEDNKHVITDPNLIFEGMQLRITKAKTKPVKNYSAVGKQVEKVLTDVQDLKSFKDLMNIL